MDQVGRVIMKKGAQMATKKFLDKQLNENKDRNPGGQWDPYFEYRPNHRGKMKKVKKQIPDYIPPQDAAILAQVRKWAYRLDVKMSFMGMRFGWATVIGAVPEIGEIIDVILAYYVYSQCKKIDGGLDGRTKMKMKAWIATDALIGMVPFVGDLLDASIKSNARNCRLLEEFLDQEYKPKHMAEEEDRMTTEKQRRDPNYRPPAPATVYEDFSDEEHHHNDNYRDHSPDGRRDNGRVPNGHSRVDRRGTGRSGRSTAYDEKRNGEKRRR